MIERINNIITKIVLVQLRSIILSFFGLLLVIGDVNAQVDLLFEAEKGTLLGTASITSCSLASGGEMVRDIDDGINNALEISGVNIPESGSYFITVSYLTLQDRTLSYKLNDGSDLLINMSPSGELWCYQGGVPTDHTFLADFVSGENKLLFYDAPIIDKIRIRSDTAKRKPSAFYLSASTGNDLNDGRSTSTAWQTLEKVNGLDLVPGDSILFRAGDTFKGNLSITEEGGVDGLPIFISSYADGELPILDGDGHLSTIHIINSGYLHISSVEVTNNGGPAQPGDPEDLRYGIYIENTYTDGTTFDHYRLNELTFNNIFPTVEVTDDDNTGVNAHAINTSGSWGDDVNPTRFRDMIIEDCYFTRTARHATYYKAIDSLVIKNNLFEHVGGAGMVIGNNCTNILVEHNVTDHTGSKIDPRMAGRGSGIWCFRSTNLTVQHNKFMYARGIHDSYGMHIDIGNKNVVYQYNYSEGNEGGFVEILGANINVGYRYNLSVGDGWRKRGNRYGQIFWLAGWSGDPANPIGSDSIFVYNNSIYVPDTIAPGIWIESVSKHAHIYNNIITVANDFGPVVINNQADLNDFDYNIWYGNIPLVDEDGDPYRGSNALMNDPMFKSSIVTGEDDFVLQTVSPAIGAGLTIYNSSISHEYDYFHNNGEQDYYGNEVFTDALPNIGAYNIGGDKVITGEAISYIHETYSLYPNPLKRGDILTIRLNSDLGSDLAAVKIVDVTGNKAMEGLYKIINQIHLETSMLSNGCYLLKIEEGSKQYVQKLLVF